jgi:hypothetical protein
MKSSLIAAISVLSAACLSGRAVAYCLEYGANSLTGTLVRQTYPGPPDYESLTAGDRPLVIWVLVLDYTVCVAHAGHKLPREDYEREVQLVFKNGQQAQYRSLLGKRVTVAGNLRHGYADYKQLLLEPKAIVRARARM